MKGKPSDSLKKIHIISLTLEYDSRVVQYSSYNERGWKIKAYYCWAEKGLEV